MYINLLKNKEFRRFIEALILLNIGRKLSWVALGWFVYEITGSAVAIGAVISTATLAPLLSSIFVGGLLDGYNRKTLMVYENLARGVLLGLIPILHWLGLLNFPLILVIVGLDGLLSSFTTVGSSSILPSFVKKEQLEEGNAVVTLVNQVGSLIGPALGGFAIAFFTAPGTLFINVLFYLVASFLYMTIPEEVYHRDIERIEKEKVVTSIPEKWHRFVRDTLTGFKYILSYRILLIIASITLFFNFAYAPLESAFPVFVDRILLSGPEVLGVMWSCFAVGSLAGSIIWTKLSIKVPYSYSLGSVIMLWGLIPVLLSFVVLPEVAYLLMLVGGIVYAPYNIVAPTIRQKLVPNEIRGRVFGVYGLISGIGFPIGVYLGGLMTEQFGVSLTVAGSGILTITVGLFVLFSKSLRFNDTEQLAVKSAETYST